MALDQMARAVVVLGWERITLGSPPRSAEGGGGARRLRAATFQRCLRLLVKTGATMQVLVGETNCPSVESLMDALDLGYGQFQVVSAAKRARGQFIVVMQPPPLEPCRRCQPDWSVQAMQPCRLSEAERGEAGLGLHDVVAARIAPATAAARATLCTAAADGISQRLSLLDAVARKVLAGAWAFHRSEEADGLEDEEQAPLLTRPPSC